jgi:hypothetical protein
MDTPPTNNVDRPNFMHFRRGDGDEEGRGNDMMSKFGPSISFLR